jgi:dihydrofolate reductase
VARILYSVSASLDGFIAGPGGDMSWLAPHLGPNRQAEELVDQIGALLIGGRTFYGDDPNRGTDREGAFEGAWSGPQVVVTSRPPEQTPPDTRIVGDLPTAVELATQAAGDRYVNVLGATIAHGCLDLGVLDEVLVIVVPVLLGDGVRLFEQPGGANVALRRRSVVEAPGATNLWFDVVR